MTYTIEEHEGVQVLTVDNILHEADNQTILQEVNGLIESGNIHFVINLAEMKFMNSTGLRLLIAILTNTRNKGGETGLINVSDQVSKLLIMTKLQSVFSIYESPEAAAEAMLKKVEE